MKKIVPIFALLLFAPSLAGCFEDNSGAGRESKATAQMAEQAAVTVGMPGIMNWSEKRQLKAIYELRDQANLLTYTYIRDLAGKMHSVCPTTSVGFGIPYATQYTAPTARRMVAPLYPDGTTSQWQGYDAPQPEPNGLHMPSAAEGTWVICLNPKTKELAPTYIEDRVSVYLFEMPHVD